MGGILGSTGISSGGTAKEKKKKEPNLRMNAHRPSALKKAGHLICNAPPHEQGTRHRNDKGKKKKGGYVNRATIGIQQGEKHTTNEPSPLVDTVAWTKDPGGRQTGTAYEEREQITSNISIRGT